MVPVPRDYQAEAIEKGVAYLHGEAKKGTKKKRRNGIIIAPTGSGKSIVIAGIVTRLDGPAIVLQPTKEILEQNLRKLQDYGYRPAVFSASLDRREVGAITLATIGSIVGHPEYFQQTKYVLVDECHVVNAKGGMYDDLVAALPDARVLGLTATPFRLSSNSFGSELRFLTRTRPRIFTDVVHYTQIGHLFAEGYLSPVEYRVVETVRPSKLVLNTKGSDYTDKSVQLELLATGFVGRLAEETFRALDEGRKNVLVFTRFVSESEHLARIVPGTAVVTADTPAVERARILADFKCGKIRVVANVGIVAIGFDYPELECVILGRPSISLMLYYQQVGRGIRPVYADGADLSTRAGRLAGIASGPKPRTHVVDLVGLVDRFGPLDQFRLERDDESKEKWEITSGGRPLTNTYFGGTQNRFAPKWYRKPRG